MANIEITTGRAVIDLRPVMGRKGPAGPQGAPGASIKGDKGDVGAKGDPGLPGVNAVPADQAVGAYADNPESDTHSAIQRIVEGALGGGTTGLVRIEKGTLTDLNTPRPEWAGVVDWWINEGSGLPLNIAPGDVWSEIAAEPYVPPTPAEIFGGSLLAWWDERVSPPADGADYGTLLDQTSGAKHMVPLSTGMTDIPQYDADGIGGNPAVYQPAISALGVPSALSWGTGALTVISGCLFGPTNAASQYVFNGQNNGTASFSLATNSGGDSWLMRRGGTVRAAGAMVGGRNVPHATIAMFDGDNSAFWDNGVKTPVANPGTNAVTAFKMGVKQDIASGDLAPAPGLRFTSPIVVNRAITDSEAALVTSYMRHRMGVS